MTELFNEGERRDVFEKLVFLHHAEPARLRFCYPYAGTLTAAHDELERVAPSALRIRNIRGFFVADGHDQLDSTTPSAGNVSFHVFGKPGTNDIAFGSDDINPGVLETGALGGEDPNRTINHDLVGLRHVGGYADIQLGLGLPCHIENADPDEADTYDQRDTPNGFHGDALSIMNGAVEHKRSPGGKQ